MLEITAVRKWEYAVLYLKNDPGGGADRRTARIGFPDNSDLQEIARPFTTRAILNELGSEGWELVGPPVSQNSVFTYHSVNDTWHDRAYWVEREFWLKREAA